MATPEEILKEAALTVSNRGTDNGYDAGQERSAGKVAAIYNVLKGTELTEKDIWLIQIILKLVRNARKERNDNIIDLAGYVSLLGESQWLCAGERPDEEGPNDIRAEKVDLVTFVMHLLNRPEDRDYFIWSFLAEAWVKITRVDGSVDARTLHMRAKAQIFCADIGGAGGRVAPGQRYMTIAPNGKTEYFEVTE